MNLRRQLLLVSLLTLVLPWAGCQFIRETESALREGQQRMLSGTAQAIADSLSQFPDQFPPRDAAGNTGADQIYGHPLASEPLVDGYFDDWPLRRGSLRALRGTDGTIRFVAGVYRGNLHLFVDVADDAVVYDQVRPGGSMQPYSDFVTLISADGVAEPQEFVFRPEAPGAIVAARRENDRLVEETRVAAHWQDTADGYQLEARFPRAILPTDLHLGVIISNTGDAAQPGIRSASFSGRLPGRFVTVSTLLQSVSSNYAQPGLRLIVTDSAGWRLARFGEIPSRGAAGERRLPAPGWQRFVYNLLVEPGPGEALAEPDPSGREQQGYVVRAMNAETATQWFRSSVTGGAVVAVAQPVWSGNLQMGVLILQQGTDAILSLTNEALARLMSLTLLATLGAAIVLIAYSSWLSLRIRALSSAAERALGDESVRAHLPSESASDEIGDLSRSFSRVLMQLGEYNEYLRTLASKLSHELRTPLTIVTSSLDNLEHDPDSDASAEYTARAKVGAERLQKILNAMSEASRVEEMIGDAEPGPFDLVAVLESTVAAYDDAWPERRFVFRPTTEQAAVNGSPELIVQMLDKLADNAVDFSARGDEIVVGLDIDDETVTLSVTNPGPPLPERMRSQLFDSMVSVRHGGRKEHLGLGLYIVRLIAEGHDGGVSSTNVDGGVRFEVRLPVS